MNQPSLQDQAMLSAVFAKMDVIALAIAVGVLGSLCLFAATAVLLVQHMPPPSPVGPNLGALRDYLPGYSVTWMGSLVGLLYGFVIGVIAGFFMAVFWNLTRYIALASMLIKTAVLAD